MEKTAIAVPVHEPKQDRQPPMLCISGIVFALGLVEGDGEGAAIALCIEPWPPHPATAAQAANIKTTRLERNTFFNLAILGDFLRRQVFTGDVSLEFIEMQGRCGIYFGLRLWN
ncbi:MAG TPA: hypothetical protein VHW72_08055 [Candidatus Angelobacter sp.]|jgi:hypothetical protein|nr:hypothetical protein [Candidatus Angelobacter sp.]